MRILLLNYPHYNFMKFYQLNNQGISLMEILVAISIFSLLVIGTVSIFSYSLKSNKIIWEQLSTQNEGRKIIQDFINELRSANYSSIGAYPLLTVDPQEIIFYSNIDTDTYREQVRYFLDNDILKKGVIKPTGTPLSYSSGNEVITEIVHDIGNGSDPIFYYYGQNYGNASSTPLSAPVSAIEVRMVGITLELEEDPTASPVPFHIESKVAVRSLKDN